MFFWKSENSIWRELGKTIRSPEFQVSPNQEFATFLIKNKKHLANKKLNPYKFVFYSPLDQLTDSSTFISIIKQTHDFIQEHNLSFSLNDTHNPLGFDSPLLESFFHWGCWHINPELIKTVIACGHNFDSTFYNNALYLTQGLEVSEMESSPCHKKGTPLRKWNFLVFMQILKDTLGHDFRLDERNLEHLNELVHENQEF